MAQPEVGDRFGGFLGRGGKASCSCPCPPASALTSPAIATRTPTPRLFSPVAPARAAGAPLFAAGAQAGPR
eukprot:11158482-Lingulodinium_polyedra.AAC.1